MLSSDFADCKHLIDSNKFDFLKYIIKNIFLYLPATFIPTVCAKSYTNFKYFSPIIIDLYCYTFKRK